MRDSPLLAAAAIAAALIASCTHTADTKSTPPAATAPSDPHPRAVEPRLAPMDAKAWLLDAEPPRGAAAQRAIVVTAPPPVKRDLGDGQDHEPLGASPSTPTILDDHR